MFYKVKSVVPLANYCLRVEFMQGDTKIYDIKPLFARGNDFGILCESKWLYVGMTNLIYLATNFLKTAI